MADQKTPAAFVEGEAVEVCFDERTAEGWEQWEPAIVGDQDGVDSIGANYVRIVQPGRYVGILHMRDVRRPR